MARLFQSLSLRSVILENRVGVSPMCQYSATDRFADDWHVLHLGTRAVWRRGVVASIERHGAGIQIAHAGRKAGTAQPWDGGKPLADAAAG
jgi:2,4-dienoyl-CoA reductase-like NADH-dependent reductase (Old Yellow Enzyme family)